MLKEEAIQATLGLASRARIADPDHTVLHFTTRRGNHYHALANVTFEIE